MPEALTRPRRFLPNGIVDALVQLLVVVIAYKLYQNTRGMVDHQIGASVAFANADWIVSVERALHLDMEHGVQSFASSVPGLLDGASLFYLNAHFFITFGAMIYIYIAHNSAFGFVRNMFIIAWSLALVGYIGMPTAPPRLVPGLDIFDSIARMTNVDPTNHSTSKLYNPYAAVPSMHIGFALMVGIPLSKLAKHRAVKIFWAIYPLVVLFVIMATGNHFFLDAVFGAGAVAIAAVGAYQLGRLRPDAWMFRRRSTVTS